MPRYYTADTQLTDRELELLSTKGLPVRAHVENIELPFDNVVRSLADLPAPAAGYIDLTTGSWVFAAPINIGADILRVPAGVAVTALGTYPSISISGTGSAVWEVNGTATFAFLQNFNTTTNNVVLVSGANAILTSRNCVYLCQNGGTSSCIYILTSAKRVNSQGDAMSRGVNAILVDANVSDGLLVSGAVVGIPGVITHFVHHIAGTTVSVLISDNIVTSTNGVTWLPANIPTRGLVATNNDLNCSGAPFNGFTSATARVNVKANLGPGGLLSETAIVP